MRSNPTESHWQATQKLQARALSNDSFLRHAGKQPVFHSEDIFGAKPRRVQATGDLPRAAPRARMEEMVGSREHIIHGLPRDLARYHKTEADSTGESIKRCSHCQSKGRKRAKNKHVPMASSASSAKLTAHA